jgi:hypothetical protein
MLEEYLSFAPRNPGQDKRRHPGTALHAPGRDRVRRICGIVAVAEHRMERKTGPIGPRQGQSDPVARFEHPGSRHQIDCQPQ